MMVPQADARLIALFQIRPLPLPSKSFSVHDSTIALLYDAMQSEVLTNLLPNHDRFEDTKINEWHSRLAFL
jgi:hypothetical protein